mgnify:CR=1 FL=1
MALDRTKERRLTVAPLTQSDAMELFQIVGRLEGMAAGATAERPAVERAEVVTRLRALNADLAAAGRATPADSPQLFDLDNAFHRAYMEAGAGARLLALLGDSITTDHISPAGSIAEKSPAEIGRAHV